MSVNSKNITTQNVQTSANNDPNLSKSTMTQMDDGGASNNVVGKINTVQEAKNVAVNSEDSYSGLYHAAGIYKRNEIDYFSKRYRFGILNPYESLTNCREYLFFTKPDLNIYPRDNTNGSVSKELNSYLQTKPYWRELASKNYEIIKLLQMSIDPGDKFNHLLENMVQSNLDVPGVTAEMIETPNNMYGVGYTYRGSSEASDDSFDFSLEFKDTKYLPVYHFFKAYEDYETLKHHGQLEPWRQYIMDKILYDQYSIYKFIVDEDGETIIYYAKFFGVKSKSLPRDVFSNTTFDNGLSYSIDFNAAFFDDMKPYILTNFNEISRSFYQSRKYQVDVHNHVLDRPDNRAAKAAYIVSENSTLAPGGKVYKLKWRGDDKY